jgi:hypothetical protein
MYLVCLVMPKASDMYGHYLSAGSKILKQNVGNYHALILTTGTICYETCGNNMFSGPETASVSETKVCSRMSQSISILLYTKCQRKAEKRESSINFAP